MLKRMRRLGGKAVSVLTSRQFLIMAGLALISSAVSYASSTSTGLPWETPLQTVKQSLTGPVAAGISVVGIAAGGMALVFGGELSEFAKRACYAVIATGAIVGAGTLMSTLFSSSSAVIAMTGGLRCTGRERRYSIRRSIAPIFSWAATVNLFSAPP
jgi:type IV secretion system protein VirB2